MKYTVFLLFVSVFLFSSIVEVNSQEVERGGLVWENNLINIGAVMPEQGEHIADFYYLNETDSNAYINEVITDCGCAVVAYSQDSLAPNKIGHLQITFDPESRGGTFSKMILVKTNVKPLGDSLFLEGVNVHFPNDPESHYKIRKGGLGFVFDQNNLGTLYTNKPKVKVIDFYNFNDFPIQLNLKQDSIPNHVKVRMVPPVVESNTRGVLEIEYDPIIKNDLGFTRDSFKLSLLSGEHFEIPINLLATIHEYFDPLPVSQVNEVPKLSIAEMEINLGKIGSKNVVSRILTLENEGPKPLNIRKIVSNCECLTLDMPKMNIQSGEKVDLVFTFDPKGRRGIDHKTITFFSNDPLTPTKTVVIKSRID
ncbi:DUF1573 domain-containing protein [uncultured Cyclobacterium sp.]|uniref:DUF1573 domain-containing protein n=1 Tax=uncultured Cyclobacterium sp. TaxID=453820 RepID=UPI0030EF2A4C|tara:strand:+ start:236110 stop:237207 length:1098 start_codon:yes stop_codon:yes gene_type:complete